MKCDWKNVFKENETKTLQKGCQLDKSLLHDTKGLLEQGGTAVVGNIPKYCIVASSNARNYLENQLFVKRSQYIRIEKAYVCF